MANALTAYAGDGTQIFSGQLLKLEYNTDTAGTADPIVITGDMMGDEVVITMVDLAGGNAKSVSGYPHATDVHVEMSLQTLGESGGTTFRNELVNATATAIKIAWFRFTFLGAETITIDSGTNDDPVLFWKSELMVGDREKAAAYKLIGDGTVALQNVTVS